MASHGQALRARSLAVASAFCVVSVLSGSVLAEDAQERSLESAPVATASVDASVTPYAYADEATPVRDVAADEQAGAKAKSLPQFNMSQVERIRVRLWGNTELGGEYAIDPDNSLSIPRVGRIAVDGLTLADLELLLTQKLSTALRTDVTVAVEVARFRPYYIMGQVAESGAIEWRPGLKVIQAISLARGVLRAEESGAGPVSSRQSRTQLTFALAQLARLKAEREGGDVVATNQRIATLISNVPESNRLALTNLMSRQNDMLSEQRSIMESQIIGLRREFEAAAREVETADAQEKTVREQLDITREQVASIESLKDKKLINNARYLDQKSSLLTVEIRYSEIKAQAERARTRLAAVEQQLAMLPQQRRAVLSERIDVLEREIAQLELVSGMPTMMGDDRDNVLKLTYHISRESDAGVRTLPATVFTEVLPGDVLIVSNGQQDRIGAVQDSLRDDTGKRPSFGGDKDASASEAQRRVEDAAIDPTRVFLRRAYDVRQ